MNGNDVGLVVAFSGFVDLVIRVEDGNPFNKNVDYPDGFDPDVWQETGQAVVYENVGRLVDFLKKYPLDAEGEDGIG